jgi:hypothetical protein
MLTTTKSFQYYFITRLKDGEVEYYWERDFPRDARESGWTKNRLTAHKWKSVKDAFREALFTKMHDSTIEVHKCCAEKTIVELDEPYEIPVEMEKEFLVWHTSC